MGCKKRNRAVEIQLKRKQEPWRFIWHGINNRCHNPKTKNYKYYGGKGIQTNLSCEDVEFLWFRDKAYLLKKPSIDREDSNKNYTISNCRFIEMVENISRAISIPILQYDLEGNFIKKWKSATEASKYMNCTESGIRQVLYNRSKTCKGYQWKYYTKDFKNKINPMKPNLHLPTTSKSILQFDLDGSFIQEFPSAREAHRITKIEYTTICASASPTTKNKTAGGFVWKYKTKEKSNGTK